MQQRIKQEDLEFMQEIYADLIISQKTLSL